MKRFTSGLVPCLAVTLLPACGMGDQNPSFVDSQRSPVMISLNVSDDGDAVGIDSEAQEQSTSLGSMSEDEIFTIFDDAAGDAGGTPSAEVLSADALGSDGGETNVGSEDIELGSEPLGEGASANTESNAEETTMDGGDGMSSPSGSGIQSDEGSVPSGSTGRGGDGRDKGEGSEIGEPNAGEIAACAKLNGIRKEGVIIARVRDQGLRAGSVVAIKLTGNRPTFSLNLTGQRELSGLCVFLAGNQAQVDISIGINLMNFVYMGRGNQSAGSVALLEGGAVEGVAVDLSGNQASLSLSGFGESCAGAFVRSKGNTPAYTCN